MNTIFKWFTEKSKEARIRTMWFAETFDIQNFSGIDKLLVAFLKFCSELDVSAERLYLDAYLSTDSKQDIRQYDIRVEGMTAVDYNEPGAFEEACRIIQNTARSTYEAYCSTDLVEHDFKVDMATFMENQKRELLRRAMADAFPKVMEGHKVTDIADSLEEQFSNLKKAYDVKNLSKLNILMNVAEDDEEIDAASMKFLFETGLPCVDGDTGGVYTKQVFSLASQPGAGKTRMAMAHFAYRCAVVAKRDVLIRELEQSKTEIEAMLIAYHIVQLFDGQVKIPDKLIVRNQLSAEQRPYVEAAKMDLFKSGKYGRITILDTPLVIEEYEAELTSFLRHNRLGLLVIDYAGLVQSKPKTIYEKKLVEFECISELYKVTKTLVKAADFAALIVNQFGQDGITAAYAGKRILPGMIQGGQIIQRHSDYHIDMTMTTEQEIAGIRMLSNGKRRSATGFMNVPFSTDLSVSMFMQKSQKVKS